MSDGIHVDRHSFMIHPFHHFLGVLGSMHRRAKVSSPFIVLHWKKRVPAHRSER